MDGRHSTIAACLAGLLAIGLAAHTRAQDGDTAALEDELLAIEAELAAHYRAELDLALAERDLHAAGLALRAWCGHHAVIARSMHGVLVDEALHARLSLHARALAVEGRLPPELADDVRALDEESARLSGTPRVLERA